MPGVDRERKDEIGIGGASVRTKISYVMEESEDLGAPVSPSEIDFRKAFGSLERANDLIQCFAWIVSEMRKSHPFFFALKGACKRWGENVADEIKRLVEGA